MDPKMNNPILRFKWQLIIAAAVILVLVLLKLFTPVFNAPSLDPYFQAALLGAVLLLLIAGAAAFIEFAKISNTLAAAGEKLQTLSEDLEKNRVLLADIAQSSRLSDAAKAVASRDADRQTLQEVVFDKLQKHEFDLAFQIIDDIADRAGYKELAAQLHNQATKYRDATDQERINQVIDLVDKLIERFEWVKANAQIERLIRAYPNSDKVKAARQKLLDKKEERKRLLLNEWDGAVKRGDTRRGLEVLRELDLYLTPNEALALQEAARDIFRTKLHSLGVQFSLAVTEKNWARAIETGREITRDFPNSRMADEIRETWSALEQKAGIKS